MCFKVGDTVTNKDLTDFLLASNDNFDSYDFVERQTLDGALTFYTDAELTDFEENGASRGNEYLAELGLSIRIKWIQGEPDGRDLLWKIIAV
jgi:hypothetical protein